MNKKFIVVIFTLFFISGQTLSGTITQTDELEITKVCQNPDPVLVLDTFSDDPSNVINIDVNGDGIYDMHHGDVVSAFIEHQGHNVIKQTVSTPVFSMQVVKILTEYLNKIKSGKLKISRINFSQGYQLPFESFIQILPNVKIDAKNIHEYSDSILNELEKMKPNLMVGKLKEIFLEFKKINIPIILAAGNSGTDDVNFYSLMPNTITVGALDQKNVKSNYSADNSFVSLWRQGNFNTYPIKNQGMSLGENQNIDFQVMPSSVPQDVVDAISKNPFIYKLYSIPEEIKNNALGSEVNFSDLVEKLPLGFYSVTDVLKIALYTSPQQAKYLIDLGDYFYTDGVAKKPLGYFTMDSSGALNLEKSKFNVGGIIMGTSFAAPSICNRIPTPSIYALNSNSLWEQIDEYKNKILPVDLQSLQTAIVKMKSDSKIPYKYPEGCHAKAQKNALLFDVSQIDSAKVFIEGNIFFKSNHEESFWKFHVANLVFIKNDAGTFPFMIDFLLSLEPIPLKTWLEKINSDSRTKISKITVTNKFVYDPDHIAKAPSIYDDYFIKDMQTVFDQINERIEFIKRKYLRRSNQQNTFPLN